MSAQQQPNQFQQQDGHALWAPDRDRKPHPQYRWECRAPEDWRDEDVRVIWREAVPVDCRTVDNNEYARYHPPSDILLIADYGFISTVIPLPSYGQVEQEFIRAQVQEVEEDV